MRRRTRGNRAMRRRAALAVGSALAAVVIAAFWLPANRDPDATAASALLDRYCIACHNSIDFAGNLRLDDKDVGQVAAHAQTWEHVVRKLETGMMPPAGEPRPPRATIDGFVAELEQRLDAAARERPARERTALRRLNRTEYANAIRDLLHLEVQAETLLPLDDSSEGFDNIATALGVSPALVEAYVAAAMKLSRRALGDPTTPQTQTTYPVPQGLDQSRHLRGLPLGTRGGLRIAHTFPLDAEYAFRIRARLRHGAGLDVTLDGVPIAIERRGSTPFGPSELQLPVTAGPHTLTVALVDTRRPIGVDDIYAEYLPPGGIESVEIDGPLGPASIGDTPSRHRILICEPATEAEERPCAENILSTLATRAFRRPLSREELPALMSFFEAGRASEGSFEAGIRQAVSRVLIDPRFLYRIERAPAEVEPGAVYEVDDFDLASRLSFFLWSSIPDDALLATAAEGRLHEPETLAREIERMIANPKADALVDNFAAQWLFLRELESVTPDAEAFDENLKQAMMRETKLLFEVIMREDMSILRLLDADFTFVDERLAGHYGIPGVFGSHFRRIELPPDNPRRGVLGHASVLTVTSVTSRTSPVIRGAWILESLLGSPAPTPPPNVETTLEGDDGVIVATSVRERLEAHRADPACASCHAIMDPIGFTLENFDLIGAWRDTEDGRPLDTRARLVDGTVVDGPASLRDALLGRSDAFVTTATEKLLTYALGRAIEYYDMPTVRAIVEQARGEDYRFSALVRGIVASEPFRTQVEGGLE